MLDKKHIGSDFDEFLRAEGIADEAEAAAAKRVIAFQIEKEMQRTSMTKSELARRMDSSRSAVDRLLDPSNPSVTLVTLARAAHAVGRKLSVQLDT
ncbi:MAG: helix-turn-helix domain-containing protein [Coriobacteriia bacterium]|nr:helix-turn-helix domain-containing protein [Coriobacteriia bacterium]